ncbi:hypothetical protein [Mycolicibacterium sp. HK-90]|uniref:hypothetical protein n=1 Tax=Mycolicibacterium sp. HK-90 TaxID=3056937 RepID=UPI00265B022D|nr:hypothetical protein [Mycolicibacterium sp. HK-90]WKG04778.1 hypothetical protein QU592_06690 [Mycolicibacterium sp. HK-90]
MSTKFVSRALAVAVACTLVLLLSPAANGAPEDSLATSPTLSLRDLGFDPDIELYGQSGVETVVIPVLPGTTPASLNTTVLTPTFVRSAILTVLQDDRVIARIDLPTGGPAPLSIPLRGVLVENNAVPLMLRTNLLPMEGYCLDPTNPLRLTDTAIAYDGAEAVPTAVADFLPPILRKLTIYLGPRPSHAESDAAVQLATSVAAHYRPQYPAISVARLDPSGRPPGDGQPFQRQVVIAEGPVKGVSLKSVAGGIPYLQVAGPAEELANQASLITSGVARYALSSTAIAGPLNPAPLLTTDLTTIRQLGQPGVNSTALSPEVYIGLDQTRLGRPSHNVRVHLVGSYTPLPESIGGRLVATIGDETVDRWDTDSAGGIDRWVDVPDRLLQRYTSLRVKLEIAGNTGRCGEFQPITLTIDGASEVSSKPAAPPIPFGFQSMPQSLMPRVQIGIGDTDTYADTARAATIAVGLQRLSGLPLDTAVVGLQEAMDSQHPAVLISANGWDNPEIRLPVLAPHAIPMVMDVVDDSGKPTTLTLEPSLKFGSLQTVFDGNRSLLVATSAGAPDQLDELLRWLAADRQRSVNLNGVAVISVPGRDPVTVLDTRDRTTALGDETPSTPQAWWYAGGIVALLALGTGWWVWLRRRASGS